MKRTAPRALVILWSAGIITTSLWVWLYVGFLSLSGLDGSGAEIYVTRYFAFLIIAAAAWFVSLAIVIVKRSTLAFGIATVPLLFTAASAVGTTFFLGQLGPLLGAG